jgi:hypothetical protein
MQRDPAMFLRRKEPWYRPTGQDDQKLGSWSASKLNMECPEYAKLWEEYLEADRTWRDAMQSRSLTVHTADLRRKAIVLKDSARDRALEHKRRCLLCANLARG